MYGLAQALTGWVQSVLPWLGGCCAAFAAMIGVTLGVALFHPSERIRGDAQRILDKLLRFALHVVRDLLRTVREVVPELIRALRSQR